MEQARQSTRWFLLVSIIWDLRVNINSGMKAKPNMINFDQ